MRPATRHQRAGADSLDLLGGQRVVKCGIAARHINASASPFERDEIGDPHEFEDEAVGRFFVDVIRRADLANDAAFVEDSHAVGDGQRHLLVVRNVKNGEPGVLLQLLDLEAHLLAQVGVQVGERLIQQHYLRAGDERPGESHALLLPARKLEWQPVFQPFQPDHGNGFPRAVAGFGAGNLLHRHRVDDVVEDRLVRPYGVILKDDSDAALFRRKEYAAGGAGRPGCRRSKSLRCPAVRNRR